MQALPVTRSKTTKPYLINQMDGTQRTSWQAQIAAFRPDQKHATWNSSEASVRGQGEEREKEMNFVPIRIGVHTAEEDPRRCGPKRI